MIKKSIRNFLQKKELYYPLKYSRWFGIYQALFRREAIEQQRAEISFYKSFLPACKLIFDIGANDGHKTTAFLALSDKVICCEPDGENFKLLRVRFRDQEKRVVIENMALSDKDGFAEMHIHHPGSAFNTLSSKWMKLLEDQGESRWNESIKFTRNETVQTTTLDQLIVKYGRPDFIKIDVEGFEEHVLKGLSLPVPYLSFETLVPDYNIELQNCLNAIEVLDRNAKYNFAANEKLILPDYVSRYELEHRLKTSDQAQSFEVIVKMTA
ncbi:MAG: FkbM family methyltransferase [Chitinophagales bacterium]